jgi:TolB protein
MRKQDSTIIPENLIPAFSVRNRNSRSVWSAVHSTAFFRRLILFTALACFSAFPATLRAAEEITVSGEVVVGQVKPIPVSLSGFSGEVAEVLRLDLYVMGFSFTDPSSAQYQINGSNNGNIQGRVTEPHNQSTKLSKSYSGASIRRQAHAFADDIVYAITGKKGIAQTMIAFKNDTGATSEIFVSDFDGYGPQQVTKDGTIVAAPCWMPGKLVLYYTSYKRGNPDIYYHDLDSRQRHPIASYSGLNTSAAVSPDGRHVAMILSKSGSPDVYVCDADGSNLRQLTKTREDESSPCWSGDGQWICFAAKIGERRGLYKVPASGGQPQKISTVGVGSPTEPDWSPDNKWIVFTAMRGNGFDICVIPSKGGEATVLVSGEDPSFAPNSRTVVYARRQGNGRVLSLLDVLTKQFKDVSRISGSNSQPSWAR